MRRLSRIALLGLVLLATACGSGDSPVEGVAYYDLVRNLDSMVVGEADSSIEPVADPEEELLFLPAGTRVEFLLFAEPESVLRAEAVMLRGRGARLEVLLESDSEGEEKLTTLRRSKGDLAVSLRLDSRTRS